MTWHELADLEEQGGQGNQGVLVVRRAVENTPARAKAPVG